MGERPTSSTASLNGPGARAIMSEVELPVPIIPSTSMSPSASESASPVAEGSTKRSTKANVSSACGACKKAHLACDIARPCKRCVNAGKEDQCEDVPHKKRGRPKVPKPDPGEPYHRVRPPTAESTSGVGRWRGPPPTETPYITTPVDSVVPNPIRPVSPTRYIQPPPPPPDPEQNLFVLFTTTDFKILRASPACFALTGYHPHEYVNINFLDWIHPSDRHSLNFERAQLVEIPYTGPLHSNRETQAAVTQLSERELLSPADWMRIPYPNQNVRVLRSDNKFDYYNVRLHIGGGLRANLWRNETLGKVYLVVSLLLLTTPPADMMEPQVPRRASQGMPLTPMTSIPPVQPSNPVLPSFSSFAAAAEAPRPLPPPQQLYYPTQPPPTRPPPPPQQQIPLQAQQPYSYPRQTYPTPRRSPSPPRLPSAYPIQTEYLPPQIQGGYYSDPRTIAPVDGYRRTSGPTEEEWLRLNRPVTQSGDNSRRAWEL